MPLLALAREWSVDYRTLRDFVRDHIRIPTDKFSPRLDAAARPLVQIVLRLADMPALYAHLLLEAERSAPGGN